MKTTKYTNKIIDSYHEHILNKDHIKCKYPQNTEIIKIIELTRKLVFPGYFENKYMKSYPNRFKTSILVNRLRKKLKRQIAYSELYLADELRNKDFYKESCDLCLKFISMIPSLREEIALDVEAHYLNDPAALNHDQIIITYPGLYAIFVYRIAHVINELGVEVIPRMMSEYAHRETGIDINPKAKIGKSFFIDHGTGVVIGETTVIGDRVKIYQGVTLGAKSLRKGQLLKGKKRHPTIEDDVTIYSNASILGGKTVIGKNSIIGSNVFITESVPANMIVNNKKFELEVRSNILNEGI